jgi:hypothetical protein
VEKEPLPDLKIRPLVTVSFFNVISNPLEAVIPYDAVANGWMDGWMNSNWVCLRCHLDFYLYQVFFVFWQFFASS